MVLFDCGKDEGGSAVLNRAQAKIEDIKVVYVSAKNTFKRCTVCGHETATCIYRMVLCMGHHRSQTGT